VLPSRDRGPDGDVLILRLGSRRFELDAETLRSGGAAVPLSPTAARLLAYLANNRDRVVPAEELLREIWPGVRVTPSSVQQAVHALRRAVADGASGAALIRTVRGRGYQLVASVEEAEEPRIGYGLPFVGRADQLGRLSEAVESARGGGGRLALVSGPPGIGKTRLLQELEGLGARRGFLFLCGHCPEESGAAALWAWEEILRGVLDRDPGALDALGSADLAALARAFPVLGADADAPSATLDAGAARFRLYEAVRRVLVACARTRPVVVAIDDLHRADETSIHLLEWIAARTASERILLVAAYRDLPAERDPILRSAIGRLLRLPGSSAERLPSLAREDVEEAARAALGGEISAAQAEAFWRRSAGNSFFLQLLVREVRQGPAGAESVESGLLPEAGEAVRQHLEVVAPRTRSLLRYASVLGRVFAVGVLTALAGSAPEDVSAAIDEACAAGLLERGPEGPPRFVHALVVESLHASLEDEARVSLHARAVEILEREAPADASALGVLAEHAWQATPQIGAVRAAAYCERAAESALQRYAFEEAARLYGRALELSRDAEPRRRLDLLLALGEARARSGQVETATESLERAI
jgi:predicted ATPase/DNA-binding winged helix-turn-helix (wHTH) protein